MALDVDARSQALEVLRMHLPDTLAQRIEAGHLAFINEIRVCTVLFIGFPSLKASWLFYSALFLYAYIPRGVQAYFT